MRPGRPTPLALIERDQMTQLPTSRADNRTSAAKMLNLARGFQQSALDDLVADRPLPATSSFHEAARIAITAAATANGRRFTNTSGHEAAVDYALGVGIVNTADHARLDELRELRHDINYPEDLVTPSAADLEAIQSLVDRVIAACDAKVNPPAKKVIPPPPKRT